MSIHHDDVIKWKHFSGYWLFVRGIHRSPVDFPSQMPVTRSFGILFDLHLNKRISKQSTRWWFETPSPSLWRHCNVLSLERRAMAGVSIVLLNCCFRRRSKKHQSSAFVRGIHQSQVRPVTQETFPFANVIMDRCKFLVPRRLQGTSNQSPEDVTEQWGIAQ